MEFKNIELERMLESLKPILKNRDKIGYVAARNTRVISDILTEYFRFKEELIIKYGVPDKGPNGEELNTVSVFPGMKDFDKFKEEFDKIAEIKNEVNIMTLPYEEVIGILNGEEILALEWMLTE